MESKMKIRTISLMLALLVAFVSTSRAQTSVSVADSAVIKQTALDYIEGWYEGNAE